MAALVAGSVAVADDGAVTFTPADPADSVAGAIFTAELEAGDEYTVDNGGEVPANADRVALLRWSAKRSTKVAGKLVAYLNANL